MSTLLKTYEYGKTPNTYDLLKIVALLAMAIDHIGFYLFPDQPWLRVIGRISFPTFLFLVGYSDNFRFKPSLLIGAIAVLISANLTGLPFFPFNILFAILLCRLFMQWMTRLPKIWNELGILWLAMTVFYFSSAFILEYGSLALMFCALGWLTRKGRSQEMKVRLCWLCTLFLQVLFQQLTFDFPAIPLIAFIAITVVMGIGLMQFVLEPYFIPANHTSPSPTFWEKIVILFARNSLWFYVIHVIALQWIGHYLNPGRFPSEFHLFM